MRVRVRMHDPTHVGSPEEIYENVNTVETCILGNCVLLEISLTDYSRVVYPIDRLDYWVVEGEVNY